MLEQPAPPNVLHAMSAEAVTDEPGDTGAIAPVPVFVC